MYKEYNTTLWKDRIPWTVLFIIEGDGFSFLTASDEQKTISHLDLVYSG